MGYLELSGSKRDAESPRPAAGDPPDAPPVLGSAAAPPPAVFERILQSANVGVLLVRDRKQIWVNQRMEELSGYSQEEMLGQSTRMFFPSRAAFEAFGRRAYGPLDRGHPVEVEVEIQRKDGALRWAPCNGSPIAPGDPSAGNFWLITDKTAERAASAALHESEARFRTLFESNAAVMLLIDPRDGTLVDVNPAAALFYGFARERMRAMKVGEINPSGAALVEERIGEVLAGQRNTFLFWHRLASGELRSVEARASLVEVEGRPLIFSIVQDVTEVERSREERARAAAAQRSERAMREMLDAAPEAIFMTRDDGTLLYSNGAAASVFGYGAGELQGVLLESVLPGSVAGGRQQERGRRKDDSTFPVALARSALQAEEGPRGVLFVTDLTAPLEAEARAATYQQNLQRMALDAALAEDRQRRRLARDLHDTVGQSLALAALRLSAAKAEVTGPAAQDLDDGRALLQQAIADTRTLTFELSPPVLYDLGLPSAVAWLGERLEARHGLRVVVDQDAPFARLPDETAGLVFRAVRELLTNVVKHAGARAANVTLRSDGTTLSVVVADDGRGFDPALLRPEERAASFGLFSVREQVTRLGGRFEVRASPGSGVAVELRVPLAAQAPRGAEAP